MKALISKVSSSLRNLSRLRLARLQAELSRCMYSLQGLEPLIRPALGVVCQRLMTLSNCIPGSAHSQAASANWRSKSRALIFLILFPEVTALKSQLASSSTACMNSSVTRTEILAFWYWTLKLSLPSRLISQPRVCRSRALRSSMALLQINSLTSGWSTLRMTILAARRVLPPLLMAPALASAPRIKLNGPLAVPALWPRRSLEERIGLILMPEPEPPSKIMPASTYQFRIDGMVSSIPSMKQALAC